MTKHTHSTVLCILVPALILNQTHKEQLTDGAHIDQYPHSLSLFSLFLFTFCHDAINHVTVNVAVAVAVITAVSVPATNNKSVTTTTVVSTAAIVTTFYAAGFS